MRKATLIITTLILASLTLTGISCGGGGGFGPFGTGSAEVMARGVLKEGAFVKLGMGMAKGFMSLYEQSTGQQVGFSYSWDQKDISFVFNRRDNTFTGQYVSGGSSTTGATAYGPASWSKSTETGTINGTYDPQTKTFQGTYNSETASTSSYIEGVMKIINSGRVEGEINGKQVTGWLSIPVQEYEGMAEYGAQAGTEQYIKMLEEQLRAEGLNPTYYEFDATLKEEL